MNKRIRWPTRLMPGLAVVAGIALGAFELRVTRDAGVDWFWLLVAGMLIVLGMVGLFDAGPPSASR